MKMSFCFQGNAKVFIVSNMTAILPIIHAILESLKPDKVALKESYFLNESQKAFYPPNQGYPAVNTLIASTHVASTLRLCMLELGISEGDANVIMSILGSISGILNADDRIWESIPVGDNEKRILRTFLTTANPTIMSSDRVIRQVTENVPPMIHNYERAYHPSLPTSFHPQNPLSGTNRTQKRILIDNPRHESHNHLRPLHPCSYPPARLDQDIESSSIFSRRRLNDEYHVGLQLNSIRTDLHEDKRFHFEDPRYQYF